LVVLAEIEPPDSRTTVPPWLTLIRPDTVPPLATSSVPEPSTMYAVVDGIVVETTVVPLDRRHPGALI
jgi:hypothetical protein